MGRLIDKIQVSLAESVLTWRSRPGALKYPGQIPALPGEYSRGSRVLAAAVQAQARLYSSATEYAADMRRLAFAGYEQGARLFAFPEDIGALLLGFIPGIERMVRETGEVADKPAPDAAEVFRFLARFAFPVYQWTFSHIAREFSSYIFAGSIIIPGKDGRMVNRAHVFDPHGNLIGTQDKLHLFPSPVENGLVPGDELHVFQLPFGRVANPICMDATYFETFRFLAMENVDLAVLPIANPESYDYWYALRGIWARMQENRMFGIKSALVGELLGHQLTGISGIYAPLDLTPRGDGVLAEAGSPDREDVTVAELDFETLREYTRDNPVDWRPEIYLKYLPELYRTARRR